MRVPRWLPAVAGLAAAAALATAWAAWAVEADGLLAVKAIRSAGRHQAMDQAWHRYQARHDAPAASGRGSSAARPGST